MNSAPLMLRLAREVGVSEHQEEGQWTQMSCYWKENPREPL